MAVLLIVLIVAAGLSLKAGLYGAAWRAIDGEAPGRGVRAPYATDLVWVLLALAGLLLLEMRYGTILPAGSP